MTQSRDFGPLAGEMRAALERYNKDELIDLMTHLVRVYVLEENAPITPDVQQARAPVELSQLTFPQLLLHLQMVLELEELDRFRVSGAQIYVTIGEGEFLIDGPTPSLSPEEIARAAGNAPTVAEAESSLPSRPAPAIEQIEEPAAAAPAAPVTGEADFDLDDAVDKHRSSVRRAREEAGLPAERPAPTPVARSKQRRGPSRMDSLFGGGGSSDGIGRGLSMRPAPPPPPIAERAPGDPSPEERRAAQASSSRDSDGDIAERDQTQRSSGGRAGFDEPPPLADGDREIKSSNRFADLELD